MAWRRRVVAADISTQALARAGARVRERSVTDRVELVQADLSVWDHGGRWEIAAAREWQRVVARPGGRSVPLQDAVVRATRRT